MKSSAATKSALAKCRQLGEISPENVLHSRQVTRLALKIFDQLRDWHGLGSRQRLVLQCAAIVHDIGWVGGQTSHHKRALQMILASDGLGLPRRDLLLVANVARYHRKSLPTDQHRHYRRLDRVDQILVRMLAGMLRLADGLDNQHRSVVRSIRCRLGAERLDVHCTVTDPADLERKAAEKKSDLLRREIGRPVVLAFRPARPPRRQVEDPPALINN